MDWFLFDRDLHNERFIVRNKNGNYRGLLIVKEQKLTFLLKIIFLQDVIIHIVESQEH